MKYTEPIEFPGMDAVVNNLEFYKDKLLKESVIVFRNANLTYEEQSHLHKVMGDYFGWYTYIRDQKVDRYIENHEKRELVNISKSDDVMVGWHMEFPEYQNSILAGTWNMTKFKTDSENGKTYFLDASLLYKLIPKEWQEFLPDCIVETIYGNTRSYSPIRAHWITNEPVIRLMLPIGNEVLYSLISYKGETPTVEQKQMFSKIFNWIDDYVKNNDENRIVHKWQQGDLLFSDIFKLMHAVTGGFDPEDREFIGIWGYANSDIGR
ncbi:hypothetical protein EB001_18085 [bacterium]|nr:hypothetical protein [bacterium]